MEPDLGSHIILSMKLIMAEEYEVNFRKNDDAKDKLVPRQLQAQVLRMYIAILLTIRVMCFDKLISLPHLLDFDQESKKPIKDQHAIDILNWPHFSRAHRVNIIEVSKPNNDVHEQNWKYFRKYVEVMFHISEEVVRISVVPNIIV